MFISNPIFGLTLTKLIGLVKGSVNSNKRRIHPLLASILNYSEQTKKKRAYLSTVRLRDRINPMPDDLMAMLFKSSLQATANNNAILKASNFTTRVVQQKLDTSHNQNLVK